MTIAVVPLSKALGAEIRGVDLSKPLDADTVRQIRDAWLEHLVIVFRDQKMTEDDHIRFCGYFGTPKRNVSTPSGNLVDHPEFVLAIGNAKKDGKYIGTLPDGPLDLHADSVWQEVPPMATTLYSVQVPKTGGETLFANLYTAYDTLPGDLKSALDSHRAIQSYNVGARYAGDTMGQADAHSAIHPASITHPETGRKVIFVNQLMSIGLVGMDNAQSGPILDRVFRHCDDPAFRYEHRWRVGDFLMWDNRCTLHGRRDFDPGEARLMKRIVIEGDSAPVA